MCHPLSLDYFRLETEAPEETTMTDKNTVPPIEEASTEDAIVPTGALDSLNGFHACVYLDISKLVLSARVQIQYAKRNVHINWKTVAVLDVLAPAYKIYIKDVPSVVTGLFPFRN